MSPLPLAFKAFALAVSLLASAGLALAQDALRLASQIDAVERLV